MLYTLKNQELTVAVSDLGAELHSVKRGDCEYIWVGNPDIWGFKAPLVFPVCGRFQDGKYSYRGKIYDINVHGFIRPSVFTVDSQTETSICFKLTASEETKKVYPFDFVLKVWYILEGSKLTNRFEMQNPGNDLLPITLGGHPGFNVPLDGNGAFEDYYLEFGEDCYPDEFILSERFLLSGKQKARLLEDSRILRLRHDLFDHDAVFMSRVANTVTLKSDKSERFVTLSYADMPYLGVWHKPLTEAPYVCVEPWCGLPGVDGELEDIETRPDMFRLLPGKSKTVEFSMLFG
ncbi:MAG: aldose 1-epimerase family protein [Clostridia bacterium]|nr:aldose 1-epimerase family protein [Clostridia bacterium]MBQ9807214.1 aldose 1-epimerase family protein [Clostridia bacterium]